MRPERDVLQHAAGGQQLHVLEGAREAQRGDAPRRQMVRWRTEQPDAPRGRRSHAADHVEQRGLAGAVGADQRDDLAGMDGEADIAVRGEPTEVARDRLQREQFHAWCTWRPAASAGRRRASSPSTSPWAGRRCFRRVSRGNRPSGARCNRTITARLNTSNSKSPTRPVMRGIQSLNWSRSTTTSAAPSGAPQSEPAPPMMTMNR